MILLLLISFLASTCIGANTCHQKRDAVSAELIKNKSIKLVQPLKELKKFPQFLETIFGRKVSNFTLNAITKAGDNYNSLLQSLELKLMKNNHSDEVNCIE